MSFFGFDTTLPKDRDGSAEFGTKTKGKFDRADPFHGLSAHEFDESDNV